MDHEPAARRVGLRTGNRRPLRTGGTTLGLAAAVAVLAAACGPTGLPTRIAPAAASGALTTIAPATPAVTAAPVAATAQVPPDPASVAGPPAAEAGDFAGPLRARIDGVLGTWSWDDAGSEAPWIVPRTGGRVTPEAPLTVAFDPPLEPATWIARWARVEDAGAGPTLDAAEGTGPVAIVVPAGAGTWTLQLDARFAPGRGATWYWRVEMGP